MKIWVDRLKQEHTLPPEGYKALLTCTHVDVTTYLHRQAQKVTQARFGNNIYIRGLIEISNCCRNNCYYCGIRKGNPQVERYRLSRETILDCCTQGYELGFRTFVMQGGEDAAQSSEWVEETVAAIRNRFPDCAITLSLGEKTREEYERFFRAGANRYLLRHETFNAEHYKLLHPAEMSQQNRIQCLHWLKEIGYQTGTGIMVRQPRADDRSSHRRHQVHRMFPPADDRHRSFYPSSGYTFRHIRAGKHRADFTVTLHLPADAARCTHSGYYGLGHPCTRRARTRYTGRCQRGDA